MHGKTIHNQIISDAVVFVQHCMAMTGSSLDSWKLCVVINVIIENVCEDIKDRDYVVEEGAIAL